MTDLSIDEKIRRAELALARWRTRRALRAMNDTEQVQFLTALAAMPSVEVAECLPCPVCKLPAHEGPCQSFASQALFESRST